jgi:hypothetical protein
MNLNEINLNILKMINQISWNLSTYDFVSHHKFALACLQNYFLKNYSLIHIIKDGHSIIT